MKFFNTIQQVAVDKIAVKRAWEFSKIVTPTTDYSDTLQIKFNKVRDDHFVSKIGEEACKIVLEKYAVIKGPDYTIYEGKNKSWLADLYVDETALAVKTQRRTNAKKYSLSWTFQLGEKRKDSIFNDMNSWIMFVEYNDENPYECYVYPAFQMKELIFKEPKLDYLKSYKKVVYAKDLVL